MDNILLVFLNDLDNVNEFNKIIDKFAENKYAMYLLDNIKEDEYFSMDDLPQLVEFYKNQHDNVNKVVVLSNSRDLIFSWYRCYNSVVDDFIYFIDEDDKNYFHSKNRHFDFFHNLSEFNEVKEETINGRIYLNINFTNYNRIIDFLIQDNNFIYFNSLNKYDFIKCETDKKSISKKYIFNEYEYNFEIDSIKDIETINVSKTNKKELKISNCFLQEILECIYIIPYLTVYFYKSKQQIFTDLLLLIYKGLKKDKKQYQEEIFEYLFSYMNNHDADFKEKIYISSLLVMIHGENEKLTEFMMKTLLEDEEYIEYHYEIVANLMFYHTNENLKKHDSYEIDRRKIIDKLAKNNKTKLCLDNGRIGENDIKRIAIVTDQLLSMYHSPTRWTINFVKSIKNKYSDVEISIIVEDNLYCKRVEKLMPYFYTSTESIDCKLMHKAELLNYDVDIYYSDNNTSRSEKLSKTIKRIEDFRPNVIFYNTPISLSVMSLIDYYPVVYMSYNDFNFTIPSHIYLERNKLAVIKENEKCNLIDMNNVYEYNPITSQLNPAVSKNEDIKSKYKRPEFGISDKDFVMVTVGNRLDGEISNEFIDMVVEFMKDKDEVKWILVGNCQLPYLKNKYYSVFLKKVIKINYEYDLFALYEICDIYLNPIRTTGGGSINRAMYKGLPIVISSNHSDSINYVGFENTCGYELSDLEKEMYKMYTNKDYREIKGMIMQERFNMYLSKRDEYMEQLWLYFNKAIFNFRNKVEKKEG
ncbi:glycosyltransferase family 4 protein [Tissierella sp. MSJ-40]|uniref:Glycosyltransferase family 4 protein n=1 Tax=Tissierella simiarum TaxID=2841534 RepID=A0ABS6E2J5_9FIRM|nr:glycosyltransferase family 4 protein [Tissierella simiarum]MBU5436660.1 glycosyltransferase family 4 protein [Tissierella simiarum]